jgi:4'-phosphopantetheinyl transferase
VAVADAGDRRLRALASPVGDVRLWALELIPRPDDEAVGRLDAADRGRLATLAAEQAGRLLARRALARIATASVANCRPDLLRITGGQGPRRVEAPGHRGWYLSTSSSCGWGLLAIADVPVGVDVERCPGPPDATLVSRHVLAAAEHDWIDLGGSDAPRRFLEVWVRKEAVVKCTGEGLQRDLRSFVVDATTSPTQVLDPAGHPWKLSTYAVAYPGHVAAVALADAGARVHQRGDDDARLPAWIRPGAQPARRPSAR